MKVTLLAVAIVTALASLTGAADPECIYRKIRGLASHWPNPTDCASYYRCSNKNVAKAITCPVGKEYNPKTGKCATAGRGLCKLSLAAPLAEVTNVCADEVNGAYLPNADYCSQFYVCNQQLAYPQYCDSGSYFNTTLAACWPDTDTVCWQNICIDHPDGTVEPSTTACAHYYLCNDQEATVQSCDSGSYFDVTLAECVTDEGNTHCWENFCIDKPDGSAVADNDDCQIFYICNKETATKQYCSDGSYFDISGPNCVPGTCPDKNTTTTTPETPTTETPSTGCNCEGDIPNGELTPNEDNCRLYYACKDGVLLPGDCLRGNYFNKVLNVCMPVEGDECPESWLPDCEEGDVAVDAQNCNKYYVCEDGVWESQTCDTGYYFQPDCGSCVEDTEHVCPQCESTETTTQAAVIPSSEPIPTTATFECNASDPTHQAENCYTYFACIAGSWREESCLPDTYFNVTLKACVADVDNKNCPENRMMKGLRSKRSVEEELSNCTCPGDIAEGSIVPHPTDCDKYQICVDQQLVDGSCGPGNVFSSCDGVCVPDADGTCWPCANKPNGYLITNPSDCTSYFTCSNGAAIETTCPSGEWFTGDACEIDVTGVCINPCTCGTGNVAHPICNKYYQCTDGVPQVVDCPAKQAYDTATQKCSTTVSCNATLCADAVDGTVYPIAGEDTKFYICLNNEATIHTCPANTALDPTYLICLPVPSCACDQTQCTSSSLDEAYPSLNNDNSTFCLCEEDGGYLRNCPEGYYFDADVAICTFTGPCDPQGCVDEPEYSPLVNYDDPNSFCLCRAGEPVPVPCPIGYTFSSSLLICIPAVIPDPRCCRDYCIGKEDDLTFPALDTDTGFCLCVDEVASYKDCPANKTYDADLGICLTSYPDVECECNQCDATLCNTLEENDTFGVPGDTSGFCYCKDYCAVYEKCPDGKEFDDELSICLEPAGPVVCDESQCDLLEEYETYPADNGTDGFCYCMDGLPIYRPCPDGKEYDITDGICLDVLVPSCDCDQDKCSCLAEFEPYPSNNDDDTSFCYCKGGIGILDNCPVGKVFDAEEGICILQAASECVCEANKCASLPDDTVFAALNTTFGFCLCLQGVNIYEPCPDGKEFDATFEICLASAKTLNQEISCDVNQCRSLVEFATFAAADTEYGYCFCESNDSVTYKTCSNGHMYDASLGVCLVDACDAMQCRSRIPFEAFAAKNTTRGFCACDITPIYYHCSAGHVFDDVLGVCVDEMTATVAACDPRECRNRVQFEPFAAKNDTVGFCSCDGKEEIVTYHRCVEGKLFDRKLEMCLSSEHSVQKRSVEPEEKFACEVNEKRSLPSNCSQYEICVDGNWRRRTCSDERYYNPEQQRCLEPRDDMVCNYARVPGLPVCDLRSESESIPSRSGKSSCLQYFRCNAGRWRLRSCPRRHYYATHVNTCLPMPVYEGDDFCGWLNRTAISTSCRHLAVRPSAGSCSTFLMCTDNEWWLQSCPLGMYFSRQHNYCLPNDANQCELSRNATCLEDGQRRGIAGSCRSFELCVSGKWLSGTCHSWEQFEPQLGCMPIDGSCQGNGLRRACNPGELRAMPVNCSQLFYYCVADEWQVVSCLRGQSLDIELGKCQSQDKCQLPVKEKDYSTNNCVGQSDGTSVPHPDDCTRFYICLQQQPALPQNCANGSFFDAARSYCRPNDGSCQQLGTICSNKTNGALIPHLQNCRAYYNCSNTTTQLLYCPKGQYFDGTLLQCRLDLGQCKQQPMSDSETSLGLCTGLQHGAQLPHKLYCNLYYVCVRGLAISVQCEEQQRFNATLGSCVKQLESEVECLHGQLDDKLNSSAVYSCDTLQDGSYVPDYRDCTKYYICAGGIALSQHCALGSYFDAEQLLCLPADGVCPYVPDSNSNSERQQPPNPLICEGKHGFIMPDTSNCNNFFICIANKLRCDRCYSGYFFNATLQQCQPIEVTLEEEKDVQLELKSALITEQELPMKESHSWDQCNDAPTDFVQVCEYIGEGSSIAEPGDCRRYISCEENEPSSQRCRNGESYDSLLGICRQNDGTCLMENGERVGVCNGKHGQLARDSQNCRGYFVCVHGQKIEAECEPGHYFNRVTNTCQLDVLQQCNGNTNEVAKPKIDEPSI
ncbi:uncharacterized protein LOC117570956 [Drosophila albomicans]|uniref:Uncharacterized protein LOC117570956 n=1 Tax=Drosophila albomicans TaxID=7291 RepID=A0A6P8YSF3_DROAB|nr:uncharacterized protein LOC117570956 [Drosophila albomicans]